MLKINPKCDNKNEVLFITSYPDRVCGIATYSKDLVTSLQTKFGNAFCIKVCAIEEKNESRNYPKEVKYILNSSDKMAYTELARKINGDNAIKMIFIQHEFGLFGQNYGQDLFRLLYFVEKPVSITFHTVLPDPDEKRKEVVIRIASICEKIVVMTKHSSELLQNVYHVPEGKISIIKHGTHLVQWSNKQKIKATYNYQDRMILTTFGLISSNKSIETALDALPKIIKHYPNVLYLILGKTHPEIVQSEGEVYRNFLEQKVKELRIENNVRFVNKFLNISELLEYLQLTDIYLFTSKDPHQAVSGTFAYAMGSACPVISTPIPHAKEMLSDNTGIIVEMQSVEQLENATIKLLGNDQLRDEMSLNALLQSRCAVWENSAIAHAELFQNNINNTNELLNYNLPKISLKHFHALTDKMGMIQFSKICIPDILSGYTLDDNARAIIAIIEHYDLTKDEADLTLIETYLNFIEYCQQENGSFLNYVDQNGEFNKKNRHTNLEDANGRALWALGTVFKYQEILPKHLVVKANGLFEKSLALISKIESPRAIAFSIKGLYFCFQSKTNNKALHLIELLGNKLMDKYKSTFDNNWNWFEEYMTYANSILPEAMLYVYLATGKTVYKSVARSTFDFLVSRLFSNKEIKVISNNGWHIKNGKINMFGEQPIDVSYTIQSLELFYKEFKDEDYRTNLEIAFSWFLGNNHLSQIIYNPLTGGCYDGLEEKNVNLNQGAESTVCYLSARLIVEKIKKEQIAKKQSAVQVSKDLIYSTRWSEPKKLKKRIKQGVMQR